MRDITFRGKRLDGNGWMYGDLRQYTPKRFGIHDRFLGRTIRVDLDTVGQYTGLLDKNGKRIFEGDIVCGHNILHENRTKYEVAFDDGMFCLVDDHGARWHHSHIDGKVVIGNVHDNPELLWGEE